MGEGCEKEAKKFSDDGHQFKTLKVRERSNPARFKDNTEALRALLTVSDIDLVAAGITFHPKKLMAAVEATGDESLVKDFEALLGTLLAPASKTAYLAAVKARTHQLK